jgi:hypothetical protein
VGKPLVRIDGAAKVSKQFRAAGGAVRDLSGAHRAIARMLLPSAKSGAPRGDSGKLAGSHRARGTRTVASIAAGSARVPYAAVVHWGNPSTKTYPATHGKGLRSTGTLGAIRPNPWLYKSLAGKRDEIVDAYEANVGAVLRDAGLA